MTNLAVTRSKSKLVDVHLLKKGSVSGASGISQFAKTLAKSHGFDG